MVASKDMHLTKKIDHFCDERSILLFCRSCYIKFYFHAFIMYIFIESLTYPIKITGINITNLCNVSIAP